MEEKLSFCQACLSKDRRLLPVSELEGLIGATCFWELSSSQGGICWECHSRLVNFKNFKTQVQQAQALALSDVKLQVKCLSKLTIKSNLQEYQYHFHYDPLNNQETTNKIAIQDGTTVLNCQKDAVENIPNVFTNEQKIKLEQVDLKFEGPNLSHSEEQHHEEELFEEIQTFETKTPSDDIYVEILNSVKYEKKIRRSLKERKKVKKKSKKFKKSREGSEDEIREKFTKVVFTEEEMLKNREEKRNQPNFKKIPFKCDSCVLGFTRKDTYDLHMEKKHDENNGMHVCPVCLIRFPCESQVFRHTRKHYVCYKCNLCKYETLELWSALSHCRTKHDSDQIRQIHCSCCDLVAETPEELAQHMTAKHSVYCNECGEKFKALSTLKSHIRRIHAVKREFICDLCGKTFKTKSRLESHIVTHNATIAQKLSYCALCRVQYKNIYVYRNHLRTSANHAEQTYQCLDCDKKFASKVYWKKHYNFYHLHKSQFRCDLCNKLFISEWRLTRHGQTQHGRARARDHRCAACGKLFFTLSTLKGHQLTHSEQRSFMCEDCGDTFKQRPALYTHYKLVHRGLKRRKKVT